MPNIVADQQGDDTGRHRANNIPVNAAKIDGIVQFLADFFKSLPFLCQSVLGLIPFGSGGLEVFLDVFGNFSDLNHSVSDIQLIPFHYFCMFENDFL